MLAKNTRGTVATVAVALITGLVVALLVTLMPAPAQASSGPNPIIDPEPVRECNDSKDNDNDGKIDLRDPGCATSLDNSETDPTTPPPSQLKQCEDGKDNDNDGKIDLQDPDCASAADDIEGTDPTTLPPSQPKQCEDGKDNDNDGKIDFGTGANNDPGCESKTDDTENTDPPITNPQPKQCEDGKDNDNDGKIDFGTGASNDPGCESATDNDEDNQPNTAPTIDPIKPVTGSKIRNRSPLIAAKVSDAETDLTRSNIKLFVDGKPITKFSYDAATDRLSYRSGKLAYGGHKVKVKATDADGLESTKTWRFKVVKR
jgi:hypothetical protein